MKMEKQRTLPMKEFFPSLKELVKPNYLKAMWPVAGVSIIFIALAAILALLNSNIAASLSMTMMMVMYGMASPVAILFSLLEIIGIVAIIAALAFLLYFSLALLLNIHTKIRWLIQNNQLVLAQSGCTISTCERIKYGGSCFILDCSLSCGVYHSTLLMHYSCHIYLE